MQPNRGNRLPTQQAPAAWQEVYDGGAPEAERLVFRRLAQDITDVQLKTKKKTKLPVVQRTLHVKAGASIRNAELAFRRDLPEEFRVGFAQPGATYSTILRFSNASAVPQADHKPDLRGIALRISVSPEEQHDLLATSFPVSHARNARQFVAFAKATAGGPLGRIAGLIGLAFRFGPFEVARMVANISKGRKREVRSYALETYWSRGAMRWGGHPVRFLIRPTAGTEPAGPLDKSDPDALAAEFVERMAAGDIVFDLCLQPYVDERSTPIEDTAVEWTETAAPPVLVATLRIPRQASSVADARALDDLSFSPWNTTADFEPLGNLNRAREEAYAASAAHRLAYR